MSGPSKPLLPITIVAKILFTIGVSSPSTLRECLQTCKAWNNALSEEQRFFLRYDLRSETPMPNPLCYWPNQLRLLLDTEKLETFVCRFDWLLASDIPLAFRWEDLGFLLQRQESLLGKKETIAKESSVRRPAPSLVAGPCFAKLAADIEVASRMCAPCDYHFFGVPLLLSPFPREMASPAQVYSALFARLGLNPALRREYTLFRAVIGDMRAELETRGYLARATAALGRECHPRCRRGCRGAHVGCSADRWRYASDGFGHCAGAFQGFPQELSSVTRI